MWRVAIVQSPVLRLYALIGTLQCLVMGQTAVLPPTQYGWEGDAAVPISGFGLASYSPSDSLQLQVSTSNTGTVASFNPAATYSYANGGSLPAADIAIDALASDLILALNNWTYAPATSTFRGDVTCVMILFSMPSQTPLSVGAFTITIRPVNKPPAVAFTGLLNPIPENGAITFSSSLPSLVVSDDSESGLIETNITIAAISGNTPTPSGGTIAINPLAADAINNLLLGTTTPSALSIIFQANLTTTNLALDGLVYKPAQYFYGSVSVIVTVNDRAQFGAGPAYITRRVLPLTVSHVSFPPTINTPAVTHPSLYSSCVVNATACSFVFSLTDPQNVLNAGGAGTEYLYAFGVSAGCGQLALAATTTGLVSYPSNAPLPLFPIFSTDLPLSGTLNAVNSALAAGVTFRPTPGFVGNCSITVTASNGGTGPSNSPSAVMQMRVQSSIATPIVALSSTAVSLPALSSSAAPYFVLSSSAEDQRIVVNVTTVIVSPSASLGGPPIGAVAFVYGWYLVTIIYLYVRNSSQQSKVALYRASPTKPKPGATAAAADSPNAGAVEISPPHAGGLCRRLIDAFHFDHVFCSIYCHRSTLLVTSTGTTSAVAHAREGSHSDAAAPSLARAVSANGATQPARSRLLASSELSSLCVSRGYEHASLVFCFALAICMVNAIIYSTAPPFRATNDNNEAAVGIFSVVVISPVFYLCALLFRRGCSSYSDAVERVRISALKRPTIASPQLVAAGSGTPDRTGKAGGGSDAMRPLQLGSPAPDSSAPAAARRAFGRPPSNGGATAPLATPIRVTIEPGASPLPGASEPPLSPASAKEEKDRAMLAAIGNTPNQPRGHTIPAVNVAGALAATGGGAAASGGGGGAFRPQSASVTGTGRTATGRSARTARIFVPNPPAGVHPSLLCDNCEERIATVSCRECKQKLCGDDSTAAAGGSTSCARVLHRHHTMQSHTRVPLTRSDSASASASASAAGGVAVAADSNTTASGAGAAAAASADGGAHPFSIADSKHSGDQRRATTGAVTTNGAANASTAAGAAAGAAGASVAIDMPSKQRGSESALATGAAAQQSVIHPARPLSYVPRWVYMCLFLWCVVCTALTLGFASNWPLVEADWIDASDLSSNITVRWVASVGFALLFHIVCVEPLAVAFGAWIQYERVIAKTELRAPCWVRCGCGVCAGCCANDNAVSTIPRPPISARRS